MNSKIFLLLRADKHIQSGESVNII